MTAQPVGRGFSPDSLGYGKALKARSSKAQGEGRAAAETLGWT